MPLVIEFDFLADPARLFLAVPMADQADLLPLRQVGPERLAEAPLIGGNHARCGGEDVWRGAVVLLQPDHLGTGKILFEPQDVAHLGAAPAVDRLVVVADAADVAMPLRQQPQPEILRDVGVLILVDEDVAEPALILRQHVVVGLEDGQDVQQQVTEIDRVQRSQPLLILRIELDTAMVVGTSLACRDLFGRPGAVLPVVDMARELPGRPALLVDVGSDDELLEQADLVVGVEDGEVRLQAGKLGMAPQDLHAQGVKGAQPRHPLDRLTQQTRHPFLHLAGSLVGEGHCHDLVRARMARVQQMRDPRCQRLRLARTGARQHEYGALERLDRLALRGIEIVEVRGGSRSHRARGKRSAFCPFERIAFVEASHGRHSTDR